MKIIDLTNQKIGRLTVLAVVGVDPKTKTKIWSCRCDCGVEKNFPLSRLRSGKTNSCGCLVADVNRSIRLGKPAAHRTHNESGYGSKRSAEFVAWLGMRQRCSDTARAGYAQYGGRGISVCPEWQDSFESFLQDMGKRPSPLHSIDRTNNDGNYEKSNCRWALPIVQQNNKGNKLIEVSGQWLTVSELCRIHSIARSTASNRIKAMGDTFSIKGLLRKKSSLIDV